MNFCRKRELQAEEGQRAVVTHSLRELHGDGFRHLSGLDHAAERGGQDPAEHLEAGTVAQELAGIRDHAGERAQEIDAADVFQLAFHADGRVAEPPGGSEADRAAERTGERGERGLVNLVQAVEHDLQAAVEPVQEADEFRLVRLEKIAYVAA